MFRSAIFPLSLVLSLFLIVSCKEQKKGLDKPSTPEKTHQNKEALSNNRENAFFRLDFTKDNVDRKSFEKHFYTNFPHNDPTQGKVVYDQSKWLHDDLFSYKESEGLLAYTRFREDNLGYDSYRLTTKSYFNLSKEIPKILFVFKGELPSSPGMWPAWWLNGSYQESWTYQEENPALTDDMLEKYSGKGPSHSIQSPVNNTDWPAAGEIDIIENINGGQAIYNVIHACPDMCDSEWNNDGQIINCANALPTDVNKGCSGETYQLEKPEGTFACLWEKEQISFYYWPPNTTFDEKGGPLDSLPNPDLWTGQALKNRVKLMENEVACDPKLHQEWQCKNCENSNSCTFKNMKMIFNVTLCGAWAGNEYDETDKALQNCEDYIMGEGIKAIDNRYAKIEYVAVVKP